MKRLRMRAGRLGRAVARRTRPALIYGLALAGIGLVLVGIALIFLPAALIAGGLSIFFILTFDPTQARRITWPR